MSDTHPRAQHHPSPCSTAIIGVNVLHQSNHNYAVSDVNYSMEPVDEKPRKQGSQRGARYKYDPIIEAFLESEHSLVRVEGTGREAYYLYTQLRRALERRDINNVAVSVRNKEVYLEKT